MAPVSHAGELLGLIVVERPERADAFTEEDDRVLTELARQAGLAFHNAQLDSALQTTLDALRQQAEELRESRARIVASGDAERRRVERNLHDGAQQHLVALAINLRLAKDIVAEDPAGARPRCWARWPRTCRRRSRSCASWRTGSTRRCWPTTGLGDALRATARRSPLAVYVTVADEVGPVSRRGGGRHLLLLHRGAAERGQARPGRDRAAAAVDRGRRPAVLGHRRRARASTPRWRGAGTAT